MSVHLTIKTVQPPPGQAASEFPVDIDGSATVEELKEQVAGRIGMPKDHIRLVCAGRIWQDAFTIASYEPSAGAIVHCLSNPPRATPSAQEQTLSAPNPMAALMGGGPSMQAAANSGDPMQQMMAQSQQMLMQNPEMMQQIMNSPMVQQMMSDPETMRNMMRMDPRLNQLMEQRPEIARMLEDPEILQQSMRMAANPSLMREMQRNADLSIGRLDAMPGGHNALVRAHEEIADPLFAAMSGGNTQGGSAELNTYSHSTEGGPSSEALPNPWGAPAPAPSPAPATTPATPGMLGATQPVNPFLASMLAPGGQPAAPTAGGAGANPMATMMQQMMSNPAMMQQSMAMAQQMFGQGAPGAAATATPAATEAPAAEAPAAGAPAAQAAPPMNPFAAMLGGQTAASPQTGTNPMAAMMQQMMQNPQLMQQSMQMAQQLGMGGGMGGMGGMGAGGMGAFGAPTPGATAPGTAPATPAAPGAPMANPFAAMFMPPATPAATPGADGAAPAPAANPMATMMQQMMSNPAMMQQSMAMAQQMFGQGAGAPTAATTTPAAAEAVPPVNPFAAMFGGQPAATPQMGTNPMASMLQQMMSNPAAMQSLGGAGFPDAAEAQTQAPVATSIQRAQFAAQLAQLAAMGFANEEACLRALAQNQGRVDAAIDTLLSEGAM
mmetsp:Transcript_157483/g.290101  ORF Transcript_157483/g.290101 Transcript_157483/m.290101 type:complete len:664 (+) Transcript_157483:121-2112(+)